MAENEDGQEKTEQPSDKRTREAREKGQRPRSRELVSAAVLGAATALLWGQSASLFLRTQHWMRSVLSFDASLLRAPGDLPARALEAGMALFLIVFPIILSILCVGILASMAIGGLGFSVKALAPQWQRLSPLAGIKRMWGREALVQFAASLLRVACVAVVALVIVGKASEQLIALMGMPLERAAVKGIEFTLQAMAAMCVGFLLIAAMDAPYQIWSHLRQLMMTREEVRQEHKESEGRPEVKAKLRRMQQEMSRGRMLEAVPTADVVVVNPTHYAVALSYDGAKMRSPRVVAKGVDEIALVIRQIAQQHQVPVLTAPPLARSLYRQVNVGSEIPVTLYAAVAQVLSYVFQLRVYRREGGVRPDPPELL